MKKKIFAVSLLIMVLMSCLVLPASAAGFGRSSYFSLIPFDSVLVWAGDQAVQLGVDINTYAFETSSDQYRFESIISDASGPRFEFRFSQLRHTNNTQFYGSDLRFDFNDNVTNIQLRAGSFAISESRLVTLSQNCNAYASRTGYVTWTVSYSMLDHQGNWVDLNNRVSQTLQSGGGWIPSPDVLFPPSDDNNVYLLPSYRNEPYIIVNDLICEFGFPENIDYFQLYNLYGGLPIAPGTVMGAYANDHPAVQVVTKYVMDFGEGFFSWLIDSVAVFFDTPMLGELSLGAILAFVLGISAFIVVLHLLR